jgi:zinc transporter ZupT
MLAAAVVGLIMPSLEYGGKTAVIITIAGIFAGAVCLNLIDKLVPHLHKMTGADIESHPEKTAQLGFCSLPITLTRNAKATDDPLRSRNTITTLKKGQEVTLLAFFGDEWAYVQTTYESKVCRLFIPVSALKED